MQFTTIATILFGASLAMAVPTEQYLPEKGDGSGGDLCTQNQKAACCNLKDESLVEGVLSGVLSGNNCALTVIGGQCKQGSLACCPTSGQQGLVNVGSICAPISL